MVERRACAHWTSARAGGRAAAAYLAALLCLLPAAGCSGARKDDRPAFAPAPDPDAGPPREVVESRKPWTERFLAPANLVADEVHVEGPAPLLEHVVTRAEPQIHDVQLKTVPDGLLQTITVRPGSGAVEIRAHLDGLLISALRKLTVLERVGAGDVLVTATGAACWKDVRTGEEQRAPSLRLEGPIAR